MILGKKNRNNRRGRDFKVAENLNAIERASKEPKMTVARTGQDTRRASTSREEEECEEADEIRIPNRDVMMAGKAGSGHEIAAECE